MQEVYYKKLSNSDRELLKEVIKLLARGETLDKSYKDHNFIKKKTDEIDTFFDKFQIDMSNYKFDRDEANAR